MARDIVLDVLTEAKGRGLLDAANQMDRLADRTDGTNRTLKEFNSDIEKARTRVHDLNVQFAQSSGDNSGLLGDIKRAKRDLKDLESVAAGIAPDIGAGMSKGILSGLGDLGSNLRGAMIPIAIGAAAVLSPIIGASIAGAVVGGVGIGGIAGGIAAAAQDPAVKAAASVFGSEISREFAMTGHAFVEPVIAALGTLEHGVRDLHLEQSFAKVAPFVDDLARGIVGLAQGAMPGLNRALDQAGPAIELLANELPQVGAAFGDMVGDIASSKGALEGLHFIFEAVEGTMRVTGTTVAWLSDRFHDLVNINANLTGDFEDIFGKLAFISPAFALAASKTADMNNHLEELQGSGRVAGEGLTHFADALDRSSASGDKAIAGAARLKMSQDAAALAAKAEADALDGLKRSLDSAFNGMMSLDQANLAVDKDTLALRESVKAHGASLARNTEIGQNNRGMLLGLVSDYERQREASSTSASATAKASAKFNDQVGALRALALHLGFSKKQVDELLGSYAKLAKAPNISKSITFHIATTGSVPSVLGNVGKIATFASGTPAAPGGYAWVGEQGPELRKLRAGDQIVSNPQSMAMAGGGGGDYITIRVIHVTPDGQVLQEELLKHKRQRQLASLGF